MTSCTNLFWLSYTDQSNNTQIMRTENNNDSVTIINNNNNNNNINFMIIIDLTGLSWKERISFT